MQDWVNDELSTLDLGDKRREKRLKHLVSSLSQKPAASVPQACEGWSQTKAAYRFWDNEAVNAAAISQAQQERTVARCQEQTTILAVQDTTDLNYTTHPALKGAGYLRSKRSQGVLVHTSLAISPEGVPLGVLDQQVWSRDPKDWGKKAKRRQKPTQEKESQRWLEALDRTGEVLAEIEQVVTIADREADFYDLLRRRRPVGHEWLIRAHQNRRIDHESSLLWTHLESSRKQGQLTVSVPRRPGRDAREVKLGVCFECVELPPPSTHKARSRLPTLAVTAVLVREIGTPSDGGKPIEWRLLTTLEIESMEQAAQLVYWYSLRWLIERYHYVLKSGCQIEQLQLETAERLERALATYNLVAWRLLWLMYLSRQQPDRSCECAYEPAQWRVLYATIHKNKRFPATPPTLREAVRWTAQLGGFLARKGDGEPGVKTLWRGWTRLQDMVATWQLATDSE